MNLDNTMQAELTIWPQHEAFYIQSMLFNSSSGVRSIRRLKAIFENITVSHTVDNFEQLPTRTILDELQNIILQAGALSRYFWPIRQKLPENKLHKLRGELLCMYFAITKENPLQNRNLRNALEHFDERIDKYFLQEKTGHFFPEFVGLKPEDNGVPVHFFRAFFTDTGEFQLLEEKFLMEPVINEILFVHSHLERMDEQGGRFQVAERQS